MERKRFFPRALALASALLLAACMSASGPQKALDSLAKALDDNDSAAFLAGLELPAYAENHIRNMAADDPALRALDSLGRLFRLGGVDQLLAGALDMQAQLEADFTRGVSTGELMARCRVAETPDCPWVPKALREAKIIELDAKAAIAKITTPARLTSWLALRKIGERWLVVGRAALEQTARKYALDMGAPQDEAPAKEAPAPAPKKAGKGAPSGVTTI